jgi:hypothetical protein
MQGVVGSKPHSVPAPVVYQQVLVLLLVAV